MKTLRKIIWIAFCLWGLSLHLLAETTTPANNTNNSPQTPTKTENAEKQDPPVMAYFGDPVKYCNNGNSTFCTTLKFNFANNINYTAFSISATFNQAAITNPVYHPISLIDVYCGGLGLIGLDEGSSIRNLILTNTNEGFVIQTQHEFIEEGIIGYCNNDNQLPTMDIGMICFDIIDENQDIDLDLQGFGLINFDYSFLGETTDLHLQLNTIDTQAPIAAFDTNPSTTNGDTLFICSGQTVQFNNHSQYSNTYHWDFGDNTSAIFSDPAHQYNTAGTYTVQLVADMKLLEPSPCNPIYAWTEIECDEATGGYFVRLRVLGGQPGCYGGSYISNCMTGIIEGDLVIQPGEEYTEILVGQDMMGTPFPPGSPPVTCAVSDGTFEETWATAYFPTTPCNGGGGQAAQRTENSLSNSNPSCAADTATMVVVVLEGIAPSLSCTSPVCAGSYETYTSTTDCAWHQWSVEGGDIVSGGNGNSIIVHWGSGSQGIIHLSLDQCTNSLCSSEADFVIPIIAPNTPIDGDTQVCSGEIVTYNLPYYSGGLFEWSIVPATAGQILSGTGTNTISVQWQESGQIQVQYAHTLLPCNAESQLAVSILPVFTATSTEATICGETQASIELNLPSDAGVGINCVGGYVMGFVPYLNNTLCMVSADNAADSLFFTAYLMNNTAFCNDSATVGIAVKPTPPALDNIEGPLWICANTPYTYSVESLPNASLDWTVVGGSVLQTLSNDAAIISFDNNQVSYNVGVVQIVDDCPSNPFVIQPMRLTNNNLQIIGNTDPCSNSTKIYTTNFPLPNEGEYQWNILPSEAGTITDGQGNDTLTVTWHTWDGTAQIQLVYCDYSTDLAVNIHTLPTVNIEQTATLCDGQSTELIATDGFEEYHWSHTPVNAPNVPINAANLYRVTVTDGYGCQAAAAVNITSYPSPIAHITTTDETVICLNNLHTVTMNSLLGENYLYNWIKNGIPTGFTDTALVHIPDTTVLEVMYQMEITHAITGCRSLSNEFLVEQSHCDINGLPCTNCPPIPPDTIVCTIPANANADFDILTTCDNPVGFDNLSSNAAAFYVWTFGDQTPALNTPDPENIGHEYALPGAYLVLLKAFYQNLTPDPPYCVFVKQQIAQLPFKADFVADNACLNTPISFTDYSVHTHLSEITQRLWNFGDGTFSNETNPVHTYSTAGSYNVTLTISNDECSQAISKIVTVYPAPSLNLPDSLSLCQNNAFVIDLPNSFISAHYDFGNNDQRNALNASYQYNTAGDYAINIAAIDSNACTANHTIIAHVAQSPQVNLTASAEAVCTGETIMLQASATATLNYLWSDGSTNNSLEVSQTGVYTVTVTDDLGCTTRIISNQLVVHQLPITQISPLEDPIYLCPNKRIYLHADDEYNNDYSYSWEGSYGNTQLYNVEQAGSYTVTITNTQTTCSTTHTFNVVAANNPLLPYINTNTPSICMGQSATLTATHPLQSNFVWSNGSTSPSITVQNAGAYTVSVTNPQGCTSSATRNLTVYVLPNLATFPVGCYTVCEGTTLAVDNVVGNTYQWYHNGDPIPNNNSASLILSEAGDYVLQVNNALGCNNITDTLSIETINCDNPLPIDLLSFSGELLPNANALQWITTNEINSDFFSLQYSKDAQSFVDIHHTPAQGNSNTVRRYTFLHQQTEAAWHYYRLLETDKNGQTKTVGQVALFRTADQQTPSLHLYPNPTKSTAQLYYHATQTETIQCTIYDVAGRIIQQYPQNVIKGDNTFEINLQNYSDGLYWVQVSSGQTTVVARLLKQ